MMNDKNNDSSNANYMNIFDNLVFTNNADLTPPVYHENDTYFDPNTFPSGQFDPPSANNVHQNVYEMQTYFAQQITPESSSTNSMLLTHGNNKSQE